MALFLFGGVFMIIQERTEIQNRIEVMEKEVAALKLQLEGRPTHVKIPLSVFRFDDPRFIDLDKLEDVKIIEIVAYLENEIADKLIIYVP